MSRKVCIFGGGAAGMLASWACFQYGYEPIIYDIKGKIGVNQSAGIFYLHSSCDIPGLKHTYIQNRVFGAKNPNINAELIQAYSEKVYGRPDVEVSLANFRQEDNAFDAAQAFSFIDSLIVDVVQKNIGLSDLQSLSSMGLVISTIPLTYYGVQNLKSVKAKVTSRLDWESELNLCLYNPLDRPRWYRYSSLWGRTVYEYPESSIVPDSFMVTKVSESVDIERVHSHSRTSPNSVLYTGRYGAWDKHCLSDEAYWRTLVWLQGK